MPKKTAFTLVELLITLMIGSTILALAAQVITSHIRTTNQQEVLQRLRDHWGRVNHLITTEALEGSNLEIGSDTTGCANATTSALTIKLPDRIKPIHYYNQSNSLWRCGPEILEDGQLAADAADVVTSLVAANATLKATPDSETNDLAHEMAYTLTLSAQSQGQTISYAPSSRAQTTARSY